MRPQHERIVIPIDQQSPGAKSVRTGSRWRKILLVFGVLAVTGGLLVVAAAFLSWQYYKTTPAYSLALVVDAAQRNDFRALDELIDVDSIGDSLVRHVTDRVGVSAGDGIASILRRQVERVAPSVLIGVKQNIREAIMLRLKEVATEAEKKPFIVTAVLLPFFVDITNHGDIASAVVTFQNRPVELRMRRRGERWRVVEVRDDVALQRVVEEILKRAPARFGILNK